MTATCAVLAFPFAYFMARLASPRVRAMLFVLVLLPLWSSYLVRVYAWKVILAQRRDPELVAREDRPARREHRLLEHGDVARVHVHLAAVHDPAGLRGARADPALLHRGLARPRRVSGFTTLRRVILPLALPGIVAGSIFTFSLTLGDYITPDARRRRRLDLHRQHRLLDRARRLRQPAVRGGVRGDPARRHGRSTCAGEADRRLRRALMETARRPASGCGSGRSASSCSCTSRS